jgi:hypothetical protein
MWLYWWGYISGPLVEQAESNNLDRPSQSAPDGYVEAIPPNWGISCEF